MASHVSSSIIACATTIHWVFLPLAFFLFAVLVYLHLAIPRELQKSPKQYSRIRRPSSLLPLLIAAAFFGILSHVLNILYISQGLPASTKGAILHIPNLTFPPWLALMSVATILEYLPSAFVVCAILLTLTNRYRSFLNRTNPVQDDSHPGPFLGWAGKEGASMLIAYFLFLLPIASRLIIAFGLARFDSPYTTPVDGIPQDAEFSGFYRMVNFSRALENCRAFLFVLAIFDITVSSYALVRKVKTYSFMDAISSPIAHIAAPLLIPAAVQACISAFFISATNTNANTIASIDTASAVTTYVASYLNIALLTYLYWDGQRWEFASTEESGDDESLGHGAIRLTESRATFVVDLPISPKNAAFGTVRQ